MPFEDAYVVDISRHGGTPGTLDPIGPAGGADSAAYTSAAEQRGAAGAGRGLLQTVADLHCERHPVMLTSGAARTPYEDWSGYCAGKAAVDQWVRTAGLEQRGRAETSRFRGLHATGALTNTADAARGIWSLLGRDLVNGSVIDLWTLT